MLIESKLHDLYTKLSWKLYLLVTFLETIFRSYLTPQSLTKKMPYGKVMKALWSQNYFFLLQRGPQLPIRTFFLA